MRAKQAGADIHIAVSTLELVLCGSPEHRELLRGAAGTRTCPSKAFLAPLCELSAPLEGKYGRPAQVYLTTILDACNPDGIDVHIESVRTPERIVVGLAPDAYHQLGTYGEIASTYGGGDCTIRLVLKPAD